MTHTHYAVAVLDGGGLSRGMYSRSAAYDTPELAAELGPRDPHISRGKLALVRVETYDAVSEDGDPVRRLLRETILRVL